MVGIVYALLSAALFGISAPFAKLLLGEVSPWLLAGLLYLGSGLGLAIVRLVRPSREARLARADLPAFGAAVLSGGIAASVLLLFGLAFSSASEASLLLNLESVLTLGIAWSMGRVRRTGFRTSPPTSRLQSGGISGKTRVRLHVIE